MAELLFMGIASTLIDNESEKLCPKVDKKPNNEKMQINITGKKIFIFLIL